MLSEQQWMMDFNCLILLLHNTPAEEPQILAHREEANTCDSHAYDTMPELECTEQWRDR